MPDVDYSSADHRLDNLTNMRFVRAYSRIRHHVLNPLGDNIPNPWMQGYVDELDRVLALELMLPKGLLQDRLTEMGEGLCTTKDASEEAEFAHAREVGSPYDPDDRV